MITRHESLSSEVGLPEPSQLQALDTAQRVASLNSQRNEGSIDLDQYRVGWRNLAAHIIAERQLAKRNEAETRRNLERIDWKD